MNKEEKTEERRKTLEEAAKTGTLFCDYHEYLLKVKDIRMRDCYTNRSGNGYCQYVSWLFKK